MYCQHCGSQLPEPVIEEVIEAEAEVASVEEVTSAEVEIAKINADRDIKLAKISAGVVETVSEVEAAKDEAKAEILEDVLAPPPEETEPEPVIVVDAGAETEPEPEEDAPPEVEPEPAHSGSRRDHRSVWWGS